MRSSSISSFSFRLDEYHGFSQVPVGIKQNTYIFIDIKLVILVQFIFRTYMENVDTKSKYGLVQSGFTS